MSQNFRFSASSVFLTYSQCPLEKEYVLSELQSRLPITKYIVGQEKHIDTGLHLHIVLKFEKALNSRDAQLFDISSYHPHIQTPRSLKNCVAYCRKEDPNCLTDDPSWFLETSWSSVAERASTAKEFLEEVSKSDKGIRCWNNLVAFANWKFGANSTYEPGPYPRANFNESGAMSAWVDLYLSETGTGHALAQPLNV